MSIATAFCGLSSICLPMTVSYWLLILNITLYGVLTGYIDSEMQSVILDIWGKAKSTPILQLHHATYSLGTFLACLIIAPFLGKVIYYSNHEHLVSDRVAEASGPRRTVASPGASGTD